MIERFLRPPLSVAEVVADVVRGVGVLSVVFAAVFFELTDAGVVAFALPGLFVPRFIGMVAWADVTVSLTLLVAAWSNVFDLYTSIVGWDLVVHFVGAGGLGAVGYLILARVRVVAARGEPGFSFAGAVVVTASFGLALGALWEMVEWVGHRFISERIMVGYGDTIGDLLFGGMGALCAGCVVALVPLLRRPDDDIEQ